MGLISVLSVIKGPFYHFKGVNTLLIILQQYTRKHGPLMVRGEDFPDSDTIAIVWRKHDPTHISRMLGEFFYHTVILG